MTLETPRKAVIYFRTAVSSPPSDLEYLEAKCFGYINNKNYELVGIFTDKGVSGNSMDREGLQNMLNYLEEHKDEQLTVIVHDLSRLARDVSVHMELRRALEDANAALECVCDTSPPEFQLSH